MGFFECGEGDWGWVGEWESDEGGAVRLEGEVKVVHCMMMGVLKAGRMELFACHKVSEGLNVERREKACFWLMRKKRNGIASAVFGNGF